MQTHSVYADYSATTPVSQEVLQAMLPYFTESFGNASSIYQIGRKNEAAILNARANIAQCLGADPKEIYFTSGGSESDNWAIKGAVDALKMQRKRHIITTAFEHHAVLNTCQFLENQGFEVTYLPVSSNGMVNPQDVEKAIRSDTAIVSVMCVNNEIGTIQPISQIGGICHEHSVLFHTDAVQAIGNIEIDVKQQNIDMLSISGHKFHAPKGIGVLYVRNGINISNFIHGGGQEMGKRAGTENTAGIVGISKALEIAVSHIAEKNERLTPFRNRLIEGLLQIKGTRLNGDRIQRVCNNVNISIEGIEGESLILLLDMQGIQASSGSACSAGSLEPSHVLTAIGLERESAHSSLRLTFGENFNETDLQYILKVVPECVEKLRNISPLWKGGQK
ncbi:MAG TPA: cysteine desulfurase NifS [Ruminococcus sp.]|nr:cysteine desulfurase NifS [Ruminococcus sp.]